MGLKQIAKRGFMATEFTYILRYLEACIIEREAGVNKEIAVCLVTVVFFFSSRRRHTISLCDWSSDVCSSDLLPTACQPMSAPDTFVFLSWPRSVPPCNSTPTSPTTKSRIIVPPKISLATDPQAPTLEHRFHRSEERRVGKECRPRWTQDQTQK